MNGNKIPLMLLLPVAGTVRTLGNYLELFKLHLCLYIGLSGVFGYVAASGTIASDTLVIGMFICMLASGAAVLNNIQDRVYDRYFRRTCRRSLAAKKLPVSHACFLAGLMVISGLAGIWAVAGPVPFFWGILSLVFYNCFYTPMKKKTLLAIVPGSLCGMLVPMIGWSAGHGPVPDMRIITIMLVMGLWQMPHFFIILLKSRDCRAKPYDSGSFPSFLTLFSLREMKVQVVIWTCLYSLAMLLSLQHGLILTDTAFMAVLVNAVLTCMLISRTMAQQVRASVTAFFVINLSILCFMGTGIVDCLV